MKLYCWDHNETHQMTPGQVERAFYALGAAHVDALIEPDGDRPDAGETDYVSLMACPLEAERWAHDVEMYAEHVEQGVECRKAHG